MTEQPADDLSWIIERIEQDQQWIRAVAEASTAEQMMALLSDVDASASFPPH